MIFAEARFKSFALNAQHSVEERHQTEEKRLQDFVPGASLCNAPEGLWLEVWDPKP